MNSPTNQFGKTVGLVLIALALAAPATFPLLAIAKHPGKASRKIDGASVFKQNCAECHAGGGNSVNAKKPLAGSEKLNSIVIFKDYLRSPMGHMPYYKHVVNDKKTLQALYDYCKSLPPSKQS